MFPWSISSTRDNVESATSGTVPPVSGAVGATRAASGGCAASPAAVLAPGEAPTPVLPGAAPSCGPVDGPAPGEDVETPGGPSTDGSMMRCDRFWRRTALESNDEFAVSLLLTSTVYARGPAHSKAAGRWAPAGQRAARRPHGVGRAAAAARWCCAGRGRPRWSGGPGLYTTRGGGRPGSSRRQGPRRCKRSSLARHRRRAPPAP